MFTSGEKETVKTNNTSIDIYRYRHAHVAVAFPPQARNTLQSRLQVLARSSPTHWWRPECRVPLAAGASLVVGGRGGVHRSYLVSQRSGSCPGGFHSLQ